MADCETGQCPPDQPKLAPQQPSKDRPANSDDAAQQLLDWRTFTPPMDTAAFSSSSTAPSIVIEFCNRCRWLHRATWIQTELFVTFEDKPNGEGSGGGKYATSTGLKSIMLIPCNAPETGGRFRVWLYRTPGEQAPPSTADDASQSKSSTTPHGTYHDGQVVLLWDRKIRSGFPELKELKQMVRDQIAPTHSLGHSDKKHA